MYVIFFILSFQMVLLKEGITDVRIYFSGSALAINKEMEPHPYIIKSRFFFLRSLFEFACPLPYRIPSFYNIVTPLSVEAWIFVGITILLVTAGFIVINQVYKKVPGQRSTFKW